MHADTKGGAARTTRVRSVLTTAVLLWQIAEGAAMSAMVPWVVNVSKEKNTMMMTMIAIFAAGLLVGNLLQCGWRRLRFQAVVQLRRDYGVRPWPCRPRLGRDVAMPAVAIPIAPAPAVALPKAMQKAQAKTRAKAIAEVPGTTLMCPACGNSMVYKRARAGGCFYGCTQWPACHGSRKPSEVGRATSEAMPI
jgi:predicted RNA-binding Zn-ribbon protein involved in translation (DUF1610 family)